MATTKRSNWFTWPVFLLAILLYAAWFYGLQAETNTLQSAAARQVESSRGSYTKAIRLSPAGPPIVVATLNSFRMSSIWAYVSPSSPVSSAYVANGLRDYSMLAHAAESDIHLVPVAGNSLQKLFAAAREAGYKLALSSAYRSIAAQQVMHDTYLIRYGKVYADKYVAQPMASEHHTGLAVDISDYTPACVASAANCSLSKATAAWLAKHAPTYGFILRYPEGKESITGVAYEPWHFRYIGSSAVALSASGLTLDEFIQKVSMSRPKERYRQDSGR